MNGRRMAGHVATDYLLLVALVAVALSVGADGPVRALLAALAERYAGFTFAVSLP
jgi:hypothetical protein